MEISDLCAKILIYYFFLSSSYLGFLLILLDLISSLPSFLGKKKL
jgi:hypothetical protein